MPSEAVITPDELDEVLENLERAGMIIWDRGAGLVKPTEQGRAIFELTPREKEIIETTMGQSKGEK